MEPAPPEIQRDKVAERETEGWIDDRETRGGGGGRGVGARGGDIRDKLGEGGRAGFWGEGWRRGAGREGRRLGGGVEGLGRSLVGETVGLGRVGEGGGWEGWELNAPFCPTPRAPGTICPTISPFRDIASDWPVFHSLSTAVLSRGRSFPQASSLGGCGKACGNPVGKGVSSKQDGVGNLP